MESLLPHACCCLSVGRISAHGDMLCVMQEMDKQPKPLPSPQVLTNGDAEFHQEALRLSPLQPESILKKPLAPPIDMQGEGAAGHT